MGSDYGNKLLLETGHYSYAGSSAGDPENCMWGFRDVTLTSNGINSSYIVPEYTVTISGEQVQDVWHTQDAAIIPINVQYQDTASNIINDDLVKHDEFNLLSMTKVLNENEELNNVTEPGVYACASTAIANTLLHKPVTFSTNIKMIVEKSQSPLAATYSLKWISQTIIPAGYNQGFYKRTYNAQTNTWSEWGCLGNTKLSLNPENHNYNKTIDEITYNEYDLLEGGITKTYSFPYKTNHSRAWELIALMCASGSVIGVVTLRIYEPYNSSGSIFVHEIYSEGSTTSFSYTVSGTDLVISQSTNGIRALLRLIV